jgi:hypothetical protein
MWDMFVSFLVETREPSGLFRLKWNYEDGEWKVSFCCAVPPCIKSFDQSKQNL